MRHILDQKFIYTRSIDTDIRKTFEKARKEIEQKEKDKEEKVKPLIRGKTNGR